MKAQENTVKQAVAQPAAQPPIVALGNVATVQPSGIVNTNLHATSEQMAQFVAQIRQGKPTGKIFPAKLSEMIFTQAQRQSIADARKFHKQQTIEGKKTLLKMLSHKDKMTVRDSRNNAGDRGSIGWVDISAFRGKDGKHNPDKLARYLAGPKIKGATA